MYFHTLIKIVKGEPPDKAAVMSTTNFYMKMEIVSVFLYPKNKADKSSCNIENASGESLVKIMFTKTEQNLFKLKTNMKTKVILRSQKVLCRIYTTIHIVSNSHLQVEGRDSWYVAPVDEDGIVRPKKANTLAFFSVNIMNGKANGLVLTFSDTLLCPVWSRLVLGQIWSRLRRPLYILPF